MTGIEFSFKHSSIAVVNYASHEIINTRESYAIELSMIDLIVKSRNWSMDDREEIEITTMGHLAELGMFKDGSGFIVFDGDQVYVYDKEDAEEDEEEEEDEDDDEDDEDEDDEDEENEEDQELSGGK